MGHNNTQERGGHMGERRFDFLSNHTNGGHTGVVRRRGLTSGFVLFPKGNTPENLALANAYGAVNLMDTYTEMLYAQVEKPEVFAQAFSKNLETVCYSCSEDSVLVCWKNGKETNSNKLVENAGSLFLFGVFYGLEKIERYEPILEKKQLFGCSNIEVLSQGNWVQLSVNDVERDWEDKIKLFAQYNKARKLVTL